MGKTYQIHLFDENNAALLDAIERANAILFTRELNGAEEIRFELPADDPQASLLTMGRFVRVFDRIAGTYPASGFLTGALDAREDGGRSVLRLTAHGALLKLAHLRFPLGCRLVGTLAENKDRFVQQFDWRRISTANASANGTLGDEILSFEGGGSGNELGAFADTETANGSLSGDAYEHAGRVRLEKSGDDYALTGTYVTPFLDFGSAPTAFDRLRHVCRGASSRVQMRVNSYASLTDARTFTGSPSSDAEARGVGIDLSGVTARRYLAVEFTLTTHRADESPCLESIEVSARRAIPGISAAETFPAVELGDEPVGGMSPLRALDAICERHGLERRLTSAGVLEIQETPSRGSVGAVWGTDRRATHTLSEGRHVNVLRLRTDDSTLVNHLTALGAGDDETRLAVVVQDADSQTTHGVRQEIVRFESRTLDDLKSEADAVLAERAEPSASLELDVFDTPDGTAPFEPGDLIRVVSRIRVGLNGEPLDESVRIVRERREETDSGVRIRLACESKPRALSSELARWFPAQAEPPRHESGVEWTPVLSDSSEHVYTVPLPFTPTRVQAEAVEVEADPSGTPTGSTVSGERVPVRVTEAFIGTHRMTYGVKRIAGTFAYRVRVRWEAWRE